MEGTLLSLSRNTERAWLNEQILARLRLPGCYTAHSAISFGSSQIQTSIPLNQQETCSVSCFLCLISFLATFLLYLGPQTYALWASHLSTYSLFLKLFKLDLNCFKLQRILNNWHLEKEVNKEGQRRYGTGSSVRP